MYVLTELNMVICFTENVIYIYYYKYMYISAKFMGDEMSGDLGNNSETRQLRGKRI